MNKTPFDLVRAIKGEPVVTRDGQEAFLAEVEIAQSPVTLRFIFDGTNYWFGLDGTFSGGSKNCPFDLFMAAPEQPAEPEPFDLARAQAGEELMTRSGDDFRFGGYNPDAKGEFRIGGWRYLNEGWAFTCRWANGRKHGTSLDSPDDLVMKPATPKTRRTKKMALWVRAYGGEGGPYLARRDVLSGATPTWTKNNLWLGDAVLVCTRDEPIGDNDAS